MVGRDKSKWIHLRNFHNAIKYELLKSVVEYYNDKGIEHLSLLDVSVGKGGDYPKWKKLGIKNSVGMDPSENSIKEAKKRFSKDKDKFIYTPPDSTAITADWSDGGPPLKQKLYDIVSCQMSLHYFFKNETMLENAIKNISNSLMPGGIFVGTAMNENKIIENLIRPNESKLFNGLIYFKFIKKKQELTPAYILKWGDIEEVKNYMKKTTEQDSKLDLDMEFLVSRKMFLDVCEYYNLYPVEINDFVENFVSFENWHAKLKNKKIDLWSKNKDITLEKHEKFMSFMYESFVFIKRIDLTKETD